MNEEPRAQLLRLHDVLLWTGLSKRDFLYMVEAGVVRGFKMRKKGRNYYHREEIRAKLFTTTAAAGK